MCPWTQFSSMKFRLISILILRKFVKFDSLSDYQHFISKFWSDKTWLGDNTEPLRFRNRLQPRRSRAPAAPALNCKVCFFGRVKKSHKSLGDNLCGLFVRAWGKMLSGWLLRFKGCIILNFRNRSRKLARSFHDLFHNWFGFMTKDWKMH